MSRRLLLLLPAFCAACAAAGPAPRSGPPDVVLVALDNVRWDRTSLAGIDRDTTPNLAALAQLPGAVTFPSAYTDGAWSLSAYASLFTGQRALTHGVGFLHPTLDPVQATLADMMRAYGYTTRAFCSGPHLAEATGLSRGFDDYVHTLPTSSIGIRVDDALAWLTGPSTGPRFAFVHGYDAHDPFPTPGVLSEHFTEAPKPHVQACSEPGWRCVRTGKPRIAGTPIPERPQAHLLAHYDAAVMQADYHLGRLLYGLDQAGRLDDVLLIVLADHGEMLGEDGGIGHETGHDDRVFHVPLVVKLPEDTPPRTVARLVSLSDIVPTLAARLDALPP